MKNQCRCLLVALVAGLSGFVASAATPRLETQIHALIQTVKGKRVGMLCNPSSVDAQFRLVADRLHAHPDVKLVCFFAPEHGLRGDIQAGVKVADYVDAATGLPVYSLYGTNHCPAPEQLKQIDVLVCDKQQVGVRFYTFIWTVVDAMEAAGRANKEVVILDRPNPLGLEKMEGAPNRMDAKIIGPRWPGQPFGVPTRHGMTLGEIATLVNEAWTTNQARLTVIKVPDYTRAMSFADTGYPWVMPSPNMPTLETTLTYPGTCVFEGTNLSEGRGTTRPFELVGAPFVEAGKLAERLNAAQLPGVRFREAWFTPTFSKHNGRRCGGVQLHVTDPNRFDPVRTGLVMLKTFCEMYPNDVQVTAFASSLMGVPNLHERIRTEQVDTLIAGWQADLEAFAKMARPHLLYR